MGKRGVAILQSRAHSAWSIAFGAWCKSSRIDKTQYALLQGGLIKLSLETKARSFGLEPFKERLL